MRHYQLFLQDILQACLQIQVFIAGLNRNQFFQDDKTYSAVLRKLEIIGEATKQLPLEILDTYPDIPWRSMSGMRNQLIHHYFGIDNYLIWDTVQSDIPKLIVKIRQVLNDLENSENS